MLSFIFWPEKIYLKKYDTKTVLSEKIQFLMESQNKRTLWNHSNYCVIQYYNWYTLYTTKVTFGKGILSQNDEKPLKPLNNSNQKKIKNRYKYTWNW